MNEPVVSDPDKRALVIRIEIGGSLMVNYKIKLGVVIIVLASTLLAGCGLINAVGSTPEETAVSDGTLPEWIFWSHYDTAEPDATDQESSEIENGITESDNGNFQSTGTTAPVPAPVPSFATEPDSKPPSVDFGAGGAKPGTMEYILQLNEQRALAREELETEPDDNKSWPDW